MGHPAPKARRWKMQRCRSCWQRNYPHRWSCSNCSLCRADDDDAAAALDHRAAPWRRWLMTGPSCQSHLLGSRHHLVLNRLHNPDLEENHLHLGVDGSPQARLVPPVSRVRREDGPTRPRWDREGCRELTDQPCPRWRVWKFSQGAGATARPGSLLEDGTCGQRRWPGKGRENCLVCCWVFDVVQIKPQCGFTQDQIMLAGCLQLFKRFHLLLLD